MLNILIMAGGRGERFWPLSRIETPKQLLNLTGNGSMIQETVARVRELTPPSHIYIVTQQSYAQAIGEQLPDLPKENIIIEPEGKNTAPCIGLASLIIESNDPDGTMAVLASDHMIKNPVLFREILKTGADVAQKTGGIVTLGIRPDRPDTGYGYIKLGQSLSGTASLYKVERFTEKPNQETAEEFMKSGKYLWNSGMFIWKTATIRSLIHQYLPDLHEGLEIIKKALNTPDYSLILKQEYQKFEKISIDYGIMERASEVYVLPAAIGWDDVGSWTSLNRIYDPDDQGNVILGENVTAIDAHDCIIASSGKKLLAAVGVRDLICVETEDAVLLCPKHRAQDIKLILEKLRKDGKEQYL